MNFRSMIGTVQKSEQNAEKKRMQNICKREGDDYEKINENHVCSNERYHGSFPGSLRRQ